MAGAGCDRDGGDQLAQAGGDVLVPFDRAAAQRRGQIGHSGQITLDHGRVQRHDPVGRRQRGQLGLERAAARAQRRHALGDFLLDDAALRYGVDDAVELALGLRQAALEDAAPAGRAAGQPLALGAVGCEIARYRLRARQLLFKPLDHAALDGGQRIGLTVGAEPALAPLAAIDAAAGAVDIVHHHGATAATAAQQAGQQMLGPARPLGALLGACRHRRLHAREQRGIDDAQLGHGVHDPVGRRVGARDALAAARILAHGDSVPDHAAVIERIAEQAGATLGVADNRRGPPDGAARRLDASAIERLGDGARRAAGGVIGKDADDDRGFVLDDQAGAFGRARRIAIGQPAGGETLRDAPAHAAPGVLFEVFEIFGIKHGAHAIDDRCHHALGRRLDRDVVKLEPLAQHGAVFLVAPDAAHALGQQHGEGAGFGFRQQTQDLRPAVQRGAGGSGVGIDAGDGVTLARGIVTAKRDLIGDRAVRLQIGGKTGVDGGGRHPVLAHGWFRGDLGRMIVCRLGARKGLDQPAHRRIERRRGRLALRAGGHGAVSMAGGSARRYKRSGKPCWVWLKNERARPAATSA